MTRNKELEEKQTYLSTFSITNRNKGKDISEALKRVNSVSNCKPCFLFNSNLQATFPLSKMCVIAKRVPLNETEGDAKRHTAQPAMLTPPKEIKLTNKHLKMVAQVIYSAYDEKRKENFVKPFSETLALVPEARLEKKLLSPVEKAN